MALSKSLSKKPVLACCTKSIAPAAGRTGTGTLEARLDVFRVEGSRAAVTLTMNRPYYVIRQGVRII